MIIRWHAKFFNLTCHHCEFDVPSLQTRHAIFSNVACRVLGDTNTSFLRVLVFLTKGISILCLNGLPLCFVPLLAEQLDCCRQDCLRVAFAAAFEADETLIA